MRSRVGVGVVVAGLLVLTACGSGASADDVARQLDDAIRAAGAGDQVLTTPDGRRIVIQESQAEGAAESATCTALEAYTSEPADAFQHYLVEQAEQQQVIAQLTLSEVDSGVVDAIADNADEIETAGFAADVASKLCP